MTEQEFVDSMASLQQRIQKAGLETKSRTEQVFVSCIGPEADVRMTGLTADERHLLQLYRAVDQEHKTQILTVAAWTATQYNVVDITEGRR